VLVLFAFPPLTAALAMLFIERNFGAGFFDPRQPWRRCDGASVLSSPVVTGQPKSSTQGPSSPRSRS
jgi:hypothetical protein